MDQEFSKILKFAGLALVLIVGLVYGCSSCHRVDQGNVGLLVELTGTGKGDTKVEEKSGWVMVTPGFERLFEYPVFQQHKEYTEFTVLAKGGLVFDVTPVLNYQIDRDSIISLFKRYRLKLKDIEDGYMKTTITQSFRDVTNSFDPDSLINNRVSYEAALFKMVNEKLKPYFIVSQITSNLTPPKSLIEQIQAKANAIQQAQAAENQKRVTVANGEKAVAQSRFDSSQMVIAAGAAARQNELQQRTLTPLLVEKMRIEKWDGHYPQVMGGNGGSILSLDLKKQ